MNVHEQAAAQPAAGLVERVRALLPSIASEAEHAERTRKPVDAVMQALEATGVFRAYVPRRFGGSPLDYQLVEAESGDTGLPQVVVVASPRIGPLDEAEVVGAMVEFLDHLPSSGGTFGRRWQEAGTLRLERREPSATGAGKMLALHVSGRSQAQNSNPAA